MTNLQQFLQSQRHIPHEEKQVDAVGWAGQRCQCDVRVQKYEAQVGKAVHPKPASKVTTREKHEPLSEKTVSSQPTA